MHRGGYYAITTWLPTFPRTERHLSVLGRGRYLGVIIAGFFTGYIVSAYLNDGVKRRTTFLLFACGSMMVVIEHAPVSLGLGVAVGLFTGGAYGLVILAALMPPETRGQELHSLASVEFRQQGMTRT